MSVTVPTLPRPDKASRTPRRVVSDARRERLRALRAAREPEPPIADDELRDIVRLRRYFASAVQHACARVIAAQGARVLADALGCSETTARRYADDAAPIVDRLLAVLWLDPSTDLDERLGDALVAIGRAVVRDRDERRAAPTAVPWGAP